MNIEDAFLFIGVVLLGLSIVVLIWLFIYWCGAFGIILSIVVLIWLFILLLEDCI